MFKNKKLKIKFYPPKITFEGKKGNLNDIPILILPPPVILVK
jgi:hypothetical protein